MSKVSAASEPSMEEILASIRRIISDEETATKAPPPPPKVEEPIARFHDKPKDEPRAKVAEVKIPEPEVLDLTPDDLEAGADEGEEMSQDDISSLFDSPMDEPEEAAIVDAFDDIAFSEPEPVPEPEPVRAAAPPSFSFTPPPEPAYRPEPVFAPHTAYAPAPEQLISPQVGASVSAAFGSLANTIFSRDTRTIEDLTKELLRPMLQQWLDNNLPNLVERLVREEIERVSRGGR